MRLAGSHRFRELGRARVSGREEPVRVFAPASLGAQHGHSASPASSQTDSSASPCDPATDRGKTTGQALVEDASEMRW